MQLYVLMNRKNVLLPSATLQLDECSLSAIVHAHLQVLVPSCRGTRSLSTHNSGYTQRSQSRVASTVYCRYHVSTVCCGRFYWQSISYWECV